MRAEPTANEAARQRLSVCDAIDRTAVAANGADGVAGLNSSTAEKLAPILRERGLATSNVAVGRVIGDVIGRGGVPAVPALIGKLAARGRAKGRPHAIRKPKPVAFESPATSSRSTPAPIRPCASTKSPRGSTPSSASTTAAGFTEPL